MNSSYLTVEAMNLPAGGPALTNGIGGKLLTHRQVCLSGKVQLLQLSFALICPFLLLWVRRSIAQAQMLQLGLQIVFFLILLSGLLGTVVH